MAISKIVLIGAGSACFGRGTIVDLIHEGGRLAGSTITLMDIKAEGLEIIATLAKKMVAVSGVDLRIEATTDRREALLGAEFIIVSIANDREDTWKHDFQVPIKHGVKHVLGENGGPGAFFHCARNIPVILDICRDIEKICPNALLINFTNPEPRIILAINRYTKVKAVGLCHQIGEGYRLISQVLGCPRSEIDLKAAGLNHFTWVLDLRAKTGEDLYPEFRRRLADYDPAFEPLSRELMRCFGLFPATGDGHAGEYVAFGADYVGMSGYDFDKASAERRRIWQDIVQINAGREQVDKFMKNVSGERAVSIICGILNNTNQYELAVNIPNKGHISNLPDGPVIEVPGVVSAQGVRGLLMGALPDGIAALCRTQAALQSMAVDAAVHGDRALALQTLILDPTMPNPNVARAIFSELMEVHKKYLPQFA